MAKIPVSYQPNKIKKGSYTDWIDGGKFCTTTNPAGSDTPPASGLNLLDAFDVDWSAYKLDGKDVSATLIIEKLKSLQQIPQVPDRLLYYDNEDGFIANYLVLDDGTLVVDNDKDLALCTQTQDIETDILGAWQQFQCNTNQASEVSESTDAKYNKTISPEYGKGVLGNTLGADHPSSGYGWWYNDGKNIKNDINSGDFNGYIMPFSKQSYAFEMLMGDYETKSGVNTSGDQIGFSIVNDTNALPRRVSTSDGIYYRNTLYDEVQTDSNGFKRPVRSAWVKENNSNSTAKVIFTTSPTKKGDEEVFPSNSVTIHNIVNTKTSIGRKSPVESDETVTIQGTYEASGYLGFLTVVVTNSSGMELAQGVGQNITSGKTGTIFVFGSVFDLDTRKWNSTQIIDGTSNASGTYYNLGRYLVPYNEAYDGADSAKSCIIKSYAQYNNGILKLKFGNPTDFPNKDTANYNGSELTLNFTTQSYDFEPYHTTDQTDPADKQPSQPVVTNIKLPSFTPTVKDTNGVSKTLTNDEFWGMFTGDTKFMYNAYSYEYLYIEVLNSLLDNKVIYVKGPGDNIEYGLNSNRDAYEAKGAIDTQDVLTGSRLIYNPITKKTFYSDGTKIFHIASVNADTEDTPVTGEYLPLAGGEMQGHIDMLDSSIIWDDWDSSIGQLAGQLIISGGEGIVFNGNSWFNSDILPNSTGVILGNSDHFFHNAYIENIITDQGIFYNDLIDDGRSIITVNESHVLRVTVDEGGNRTFTLGAGNNNDCFVVNSDAFDINCAAGGTNIYGYLSIQDSDEGPFAELSINSEGALKISNSTDIQGGLRSTASAAYSNVLLGVNNPGANETGFTDMGTDITKNGYPLVVSTPAQMAEDGEGTCLVFGPGDIYALKKNSGGTGYQSSTLCLQHRTDYYGDVLIGRNLQVGDINGHGGTGGNLTVKGYAEATDGFKKTGSTNDYVLLAGGGTAPLSSIQGSGGTVTSITPGTGLTGASNNDSAITTSGTINLKKAETSEIGGIKVKAVKTSAIKTAIEGTNYYPVNIDSNGLGYVALPAFKTSDNNTTYTFSGGTNGFTVTPSGGTAQTVTVTPSITNNITGSGTSGCLAKFNGTNTLTSGPKLGSDKTKFLRNDGEWAVPPGTGVTGDYLPLAGGDMSGSICMNSNSITFDQDAFCQIYEDSGQLHIESDEGIVLSNQVTIGSEAQILSSQDGSVLTISCEGITLQAGDEIKLATGSVTSTGSVHAPSFFETSDIRKKNIKSDLSLDKCYELIDKCQTVIYSLKDQTQEQIGMIAQEVEQFFPELVDTDKEGFKSLAYDRLVIICFKVLKDIIKRLEKLGV